ncbi:MAG: hypothetical protein ACLFR0_07575, partial [Alphaproteobacteria bacterium]
MKILTFILLGACFIPGISYAQQANVPEELLQEKPPQQEQQLQPDRPTLLNLEEEEKDVRPYSSYDEIPQEALDETQKFFEYCENDPRLPT